MFNVPFQTERISRVSIEAPDDDVSPRQHETTELMPVPGPRPAPVRKQQSSVEPARRSVGFSSHEPRAHYQRNFSVGGNVPPSMRRISHQVSVGMHDGAEATKARMRRISTVDFSAVEPTDENPERGTWSNPVAFFLTILGFAVGLGNVWRFPYLCHKNGGGAFLIPYFLALAFCGIPLMVLELALGQYTSQGPITIWKMAPLFKGIGCGMIMISIYQCIYYNMITGWAIYYLYRSLTSRLPWRCCEPEWASDACRSTDPTCAPHNVSIGMTNLVNSAYNISQVVHNYSVNNTANASFVNGSIEQKGKFPSDDFYHNVLLRLSDSIEHPGSVQPHLALVLIIAWAVCFLVLMKGIKSIGKAVYFTSTFPYVVLFILLVRAATEPGAIDGVKYFVTPKWHMLADTRVWGDAITQIFYSSGICLGGVITLASYNEFKNNCYRNALVVGIANSMTSVFSGFVVFSILGFMAKQQDASIEDIVQGGPGLTFIIYPQAVTLLPIAPLWSTLFFVMLVILALSSMFPMIENITTSIIDQFTSLRDYKFWITMITCVSLCLSGLMLTTNGGLHILQLIDKFPTSYALLYVGIAEITVFAYCYGVKRVSQNIKQMTGVTVSRYWHFIWLVICPGLMIFCLLFSWIKFEPLSYHDVAYPDWTTSLGWFLSFTPVSMVFIYAAYLLIHKYRAGEWEGWKTIKELTQPEEGFGPALPQFRHEIGIHITTDKKGVEY